MTVEPTPLHHRLVAALAGRWIGEETLAPMPWDPSGGEADARVLNEPELGGLAMVQRYEQLRGGVLAVGGIGVFRCDAGEVVFDWLDTLSPERREFRGGFQGDELVLVSRAVRGNARLTFHLVAPDRYEYRLEAAQEGAPWQLYLHGSYRRQG